VTIRTSLFVGLVTSSLAFANDGCYHRSGHVPAGEAVPDSIQGVVGVTGTTFEHHLVLRVRDREVALSATSADSAALTRLAGVETRIRGRRIGKSTIRVQSFTALRVDGSPVVDGVIVNDSGRLFLRTSPGLRLLGNPPAKLREMISARVWVGGPLDRGPNTYGVIVPPVRQP
jgi:hypothetical protein